MSFPNYLNSRLHSFNNIKKNGLYYHYKTKFYNREYYKLLNLAIQEGTIENIIVVYEEQFGDRMIWAKNLNEWEEEVIDEYGYKSKRFTLVFNNE